MNLSLTERDKKLLIFLGVIVGLFVLLYGCLYPILLHSEKLRERLDETAEQRSQMENQMMLVTGYEAQIAQAKEELLNYADVFYPKLTSADADRILTEICQRHGGVIDAMSLETVKDDAVTLSGYLGEETTLSNVREVRATVSVSGSGSRIGGIIDELTEASPAVLIRSYSRNGDALVMEVSLFGTAS